MTKGRSYGDLALIRRLVRQARPYWPHICGLLLLSLLAMPFVLLMPLPVKIAVDSVIGSEPVPGFLDFLLPAALTRSDATLLVFVAGFVVFVYLSQKLVEAATLVLKTYAGQKMVLGFRTQLFRNAQRLSLMYHDSKGTTDSAYRIQYAAPSLQWIITDSIPPIVTSAVTLVGMFYVTFRINPQLALIALAVSPLLFLAARAYSSRLRPRWRKVYELDSSALSVVQEGLAAIRVVMAFGQEDREQERFLRRSDESLRERVGASFVQSSFSVLIGLAIGGGTAAVLFVGVRQVQAGALTLGDLLLVMGYLAQLYVPINALSQSPTTLQASLASAERAFLLLDEVPDVVERRGAKQLLRARGAVTFRDVSFQYREDHPVLHDVSFEIEPGTRVGISGATGAGKSTLMNLLSRFYDPTSGQILLDGGDIRDYKLADLRNQFAIVLQEPVLFSTSIAENIAYARPDASKEEIVEAAKAANAHDFIMSLPDGYETRVGERGLSLSGGERQRISLARAFLKDAPVLILDEPTSSVDTKTEAVIMDAMERLMQGRTTFMIAHRLGTLANCDARLEIEEGSVVNLEKRPSDSGMGEEDRSEQSPADTTWPNSVRVNPDRPEESARLFRDVAKREWDVDLDYTSRCLLLVEQLLATTVDANGRHHERPQAPESLAVGLGCFLGETIRRNAGTPGSWSLDEDWSEDPVIKFEKFSIDPIGKARAFLREGSGDSVAFYADYVLERLESHPQEHDGQSISSTSAGASRSLATRRSMSNDRTRR